MKPTNLHILLVDDDEDDRMFFEEALQDIEPDARLDYAQNGLEALELLEKVERYPDIVFLDLNMPVVSGEECLEQIRATDAIRDLKVVIYSTSFDPNTVELLFMKGADRYIRKPGAFNELKQTISNAIHAIYGKGKRTIDKESFVINP